MPEEGKTSIDSKIVLKCWLDDKLHADDIQSRVSISSIEDTSNRAEFTFLSMANKLAIRYWRLRSNIITNRLDSLAGNFSGVKVIYIVDISNRGTNRQYPEALMKLQKEQGFCLFLSVDGFQYDKAILSAAFYEQDIDGYWKEVTFSEAPLNTYSLDKEHNLCLNGVRLKNICTQAKADYYTDLECKKQSRAKYLKEQEEKKQRLLEEELRRIKAERSRREEQERILQEQREAAEKRRQEFEEKRRIEAAKKLEEWQQKVAEFQKYLTMDFVEVKDRIMDPDGNHWLQCEYCGIKGPDKDFVSWQLNLGTCRTCSNNRPVVKMTATGNRKSSKWDPLKCPECSGRLVKRNGYKGPFLGCQNYPKCKHTASIPKV